MEPSEFWSGWWWPALTAAFGFVYVALLLRQYATRRKMHQLMWAVGFLFYAVAAVMEAWSELTQHWDPTMYRIYIVLAASLVGFLGNGTAYLVMRRRVFGDAYLGVNLVLLTVFFYGTFTVDLDMARLVPGIVVGGQALGPASEFPRIMSLPFNIPGTLVLIGGSAFSVVRFWPKREYRYRSWANVLIIIGTMIIAGAGSMARAGVTEGLYLAEMVASAVLLWGFLMASTLERGAKAAVAAGRKGRDAVVASPEDPVTQPSS